MLKKAEILTEIQKSQNVATNISNVVLFLDGARITRTSEEVPLEEGLNKLRLGEISKFMEKDSVRVKGTGIGIKATLVDVEVNYIYKELSSLDIINELQEKLKQLQKERTSLNEEKTHFLWIKENFKSILGSFTVEFPKFFAAGESEINTLKDMHIYSSDIIIDIQKKIFELDEKIEKNALEIEKINRELQKYGGGARQVEEYYDVIVSIEADNVGTFQLILDYQIRSANWTPSYDILITENETTMIYRAEVVNKTLENWDDVDLGVSTATFKPVRIIEPQPWYVQEFSYSAPTPAAAPRRAVGRSADKEEGKKEKARLADEEMAAPLVEAPPPPIQMQVEQSAFSEDSFGVQHYKIAKKMTIKADGNTHPVLLQEFQVTSSRLFYWNSIDQQVVAQEKIKNGEMQLLPGKVKCYVDGDFVGESSIKMISPGEEFKLGTRLSYEMKVEKKLVKREVGKTGMIKGKLQNEYGYEIKINNYRNIESEITVIERIPKSRSPDIIVDPDEKHLSDFFSPIPTKFQLNIATFELNLKPEEEFTIEYSYKVNYRKDLVIEPSLP